MPVQCLSNLYLWRCGTETGFRREKGGGLCPGETARPDIL